MACLNFQSIYFREHLLMAAFIRLSSTCFSEHHKVAAAFLIMFSWLVLRRHSPITSHYWQNLKILISLKEHTLHKRFILAYIRITKLIKRKKNDFEKFIEEFDFVELSTQAKHLTVWILHGDWLNDSPRYYC